MSESYKESLVLSWLQICRFRATLKELCRVCNISESSMRTILNKLEKRESIEVDRSKKVYIYHIK